MEWNFVLWSIFIIFSGLLLWRSRRNSGSNLPPAPRGWPVIGNILDLGTLPHRSLAALKQQYGPVLWLNLGSVKTMVVQSSDAAEELFKNHDLSFIDRSVVETMRSHGYYKSSIGLAPYGMYWRVVRRIMSLDMFVNKKINETMHVRQKCVNDMLDWIEKAVDSEDGIEVVNFVFSALFNLLGNLMLSRDLVDTKSAMATEFDDAMAGLMECLTRPNISDLFPWLRWFDLQGLRRKMDRHLGKAIEIATGLVKQRMMEREEEVEGISVRKKDFLDLLLDFEGTGKDEPAKLSEQQISILIMEMFIGGTETVSTTTEWALTELLRNPEIMTKVKTELSTIIGPNKKLEESDIDNLHYLQAIVKETLRLHPPAPLLIPRKSTRDTTFMGYNIPRGTQVLVNAWAIGRNPENWEDPLMFKPERFLDSNIGYRGQNFEFIPFGAGRRICPGLPLAHPIAPLILGSLIHHFDWKLPKNIASETLDMTDTMGLTAKKLKHLTVIPKRSVA